MGKLPKVSVVINNYNYGRFLGEAIESALGQTYPNTEVVVVDDGSTDNSREVIARYKDRIVPVLKENGGQGSALNAGFAVSKGEFILFLDSDDVLEANAIEKVVAKWRQGLGRVFFPLQAVDVSGKPLGRIVGGTPGPSALLGPFAGAASTSGTVFSRSVLEKIMPVPEEEWKICADNYLCSASSLFGEVMCLAQPLGKYRMHGGNNFQSEQLLARLRRGIDLNFKLHSALFRLTKGEIGPLDRWLGACPEHWVRRITSLRESPDDHPWPDTFPSLTLSLVRAIWRFPYWNLRRRVGHTVFALAYGLLPWKLARALKEMRDGTRGTALRRALGPKLRPQP